MQSVEDNFYFAHFSPEGRHQQVCHQNILGVLSFVNQDRSLLGNQFSSSEGSLLCQTSPLGGYKSCTGGSGQCGWASCTHWWPI